jgi:hypothetical protein
METVLSIDVCFKYVMNTKRYIQMYPEQEAFASPSGEEFNISAPVYSEVNKANAYAFS